MALKRRFAKMAGESVDSDKVDYELFQTWIEDGFAPLVSSQLYDGSHAPAIDIDGIEVRSIPSRTQGNYHLYIEKAMPWWKYRLLLRVLVLCGIVERSYYRASVRRRASFLRVPEQRTLRLGPPGSTDPGSARYQNRDVLGLL